MTLNFLIFKSLPLMEDLLRSGAELKGMAQQNSPGLKVLMLIRLEMSM